MERVLENRLITVAVASVNAAHIDIAPTPCTDTLVRLLGRRARRLGRRLNRVLLQIFQIHMFQRRHMRRFEDDGRRYAALPGFFPSRGADAPLIAYFQPGEAKFGNGLGEIVAAIGCKFEEISRHDRADDMQPPIPLSDITAAIAEEAGHGIGAARL